jgi:hypothetical protein
VKTQWNDAPGGFHPASAPDFLPRRELERVQLGRAEQGRARHLHEQVDRHALGVRVEPGELHEQASPLPP